jgi:TRAP-type C4-dicarboxylate transport system permease small subunit
MTPSGAPKWRPESAIALVALVLLVVITLLNVVTRYFTDESLAWTEELSVFLMVILALSGTASATLRDTHLRIEAFYESGSAERQLKLRRLVAFITAVFYLFLAAVFARFTWDEFRFDETSMGLGLPRWWYSVWVAPLCLLIAGRALQVMRLARTPS